MSIEIREVKTRRDLRTFIYLPEKIHAGHENWVHPIYFDDWKYFDPKKNKAFGYCDTILFLAYKDGEPAGRVIGIINSRYNEYRKEKTARFGYLETWEDRAVIHALLTAVEEWARAKGMNKLVGPYGFSDQDPEGFMIMGFEHRATIATYFNFEWMPGMLEKEGFVKDVDYFVYKIDVPKVMPEFYTRIYERALKKGVFRVLEFPARKALKPWIVPILQLMNECYTGSEIYGFAPLDEKEMKDLAKRYLPVVNPHYVKVVLKDSEVAAFIIAMPDMTEGIQKARGRLFPFGFLKILRASKKTKQLDLLLGAVKEKYRGAGLDVMMGIKVLESATKGGIEILDSHHELESNVKVRAEMERMGGTIYKKFRIFQKPI